MSNDLNELQIGGKKNDESGTDSTEIELDAKGLYCPEPVMLLHNPVSYTHLTLPTILLV